MRACPLCGLLRHESIYKYQTTFAGEQSIYACACGMLYASNSGASADYMDFSSYARPAATGSGVRDHARLQSAAKLIEALGVDKSAAILDVGCAQGGLLNCLRELGYTNITGIDPSQECVKAVRELGHTVLCGVLYGNNPFSKFDLIILSHVLEHVDDLHAMLADVLAHLTPAGHLYIEVPDADEYGRNGGDPFLDFNSEHINHFSQYTLHTLLNDCGLAINRRSYEIERRTVTLANNKRYGVLWTLASRTDSTQRIMQFTAESTLRMAKLNSYLECELAGEQSVILWGAGEFLAHVLALPIFERLMVPFIVDSNSHGKRTVGGILVRPPNMIVAKSPIIITALVATQPIKLQAAAMGLTNRIIELRFD